MLCIFPYRAQKNVVYLERYVKWGLNCCENKYANYEKTKNLGIAFEL